MGLPFGLDAHELFRPVQYTLYSTKFPILFCFYLTSGSLDFSLLQKTLRLWWYLVASVLALDFDLRVHTRGTCRVL